MIGLALSTAIIAGKLLSRSARFNSSDDFEWFTILGTYPSAMVISSRSPHRSLDAWLDAARRAPAPLVYATIGTGSAGHLAGAYLRHDAGANLAHRTVDSLDEGNRLLSEGKIDVLFEGAPTATTKAPRPGQRIMAVTSFDRLPHLPEIPSFGERWQQSFEVWIGLIAPKGLDKFAYFRLAPAIGVSS